MTELSPVVLATGEVAAGSWTLQISGSGDDMTTMLKIVRPDGRASGGGLGGCDLPGSSIAYYHGRERDGILSIVCRARAEVTRLRIEGARLPGGGDHIELRPVATRPDLGLAFYVTVLPADAELVNVIAIDATGRVVAQQRPQRPRFPSVDEGDRHIPAKR